MTLEPLQDRIIVKREEETTKSSGGILLANAAVEKPVRGKVLAVGPGKVNERGYYTRLDIKVGDTVVFGKYTGTEVRDGDTDYVVMREEEVIARVRG